MRKMINTPAPFIKIDSFDEQAIRSLYTATLKVKRGYNGLVLVDAARLYELNSTDCMVESRLAIIRAMRNARQSKPRS